MDAERIIELRARIAALERERDALKDEIDYAMGQCDGKSIGKIIEERDEAHAAIRALDEAARNLVLAYDAKGEWATSFIRDEVDALRVVLGMVPDPSANAPAIRRASEKE